MWLPVSTPVTHKILLNIHSIGVVLAMLENTCMYLSDVTRLSNILSNIRCVVEIHLCGQPCKLQDKGGCSGECTKV